MIKRNISKQILILAKKYPAIVVSGPRQSGKTTLVKELFPQKPYVLLEDLDMQDFAKNDPRGFLAQFPDGAILDEVQRVPEIFSYLQGILDSSDKTGQFILTGSQNYLLMEKNSQSLAGRVALFTLLPFSISEIKSFVNEDVKYEEILFKGFYPRIYDKKIEPDFWYANYVKTYLERDVRFLKNINDLSVFHRFLKMCAHRNGQLLNLSALAEDCGITHNTAKAWLSVLETSYIVFLLRTYHKNFNKRLVKMPKLYFYDTGLASYLTEIKSSDNMVNHPVKGGLFEAFVMSEIMKDCYNNAHEPNIFFWRNKVGNEIDCILDAPDKRKIIEIKSGKTITSDYFKGINYWKKLNKNNKDGLYVIYGGSNDQIRSEVNIVSWKNMDKVLK